MSSAPRTPSSTRKVAIRRLCMRRARYSMEISATSKRQSKVVSFALGDGLELLMSFGGIALFFDDQNWK